MSNEYKLGKGKVYVDLLDADGNSLEGERYMGNTPGFTVTVDSENLEHFSSEGGVGEKDAEVLQDLTRTVNITFDSMERENLALFVVGDLATKSQGASSVTAEAISGVKQDRYYQLGVDASHPSGVRGVSNVAVKGSGGTPTHTVDLDTGRLYIVPGGGIADDTDLEIDYDKDAVDWEQIATSSTAAKDAAIRFVANNPRGQNDDAYFPKASVRPTGDLAMIGTEWQQGQLEVEVLKKTGLASAYIDGRPVSSA